MAKIKPDPFNWEWKTWRPKPGRVVDFQEADVSYFFFDRMHKHFWRHEPKLKILAVKWPTRIHFRYRWFLENYAGVNQYWQDIGIWVKADIVEYHLHRESVLLRVGLVLDQYLENFTLEDHRFLGAKMREASKNFLHDRYEREEYDESGMWGWMDEPF